MVQLPLPWASVWLRSFFVFFLFFLLPLLFFLALVVLLLLITIITTILECAIDGDFQWQQLQPHSLGAEV